MPTECELCHEMYEKADDDPQDICPECWKVQASYWTGPGQQIELDEQPEPEPMMVAVAVPVCTEDDDDDQGYCGPTCGRFGNW
jgi:hypothetical protein